MDEGVRRAQQRYDRFFKYFYESIYRDKYYVMGDYDTMTIAFLLDTALYYFAAIMPVYRWSHERLGVPPFFQDGAEIGYYPIRFYNRRLVRSRSARWRSASTATTTPASRPRFVGFSVRAAMWVMLFHGLLRWWKAELANAWTYVVKPKPIAKSGGAGAPSRPPRPRPSLRGRLETPPRAKRVSPLAPHRARHRRLERNRARARDAPGARPSRPRARRARHATTRRIAPRPRRGIRRRGRPFSSAISPIPPRRPPSPRELAEPSR